MKQLWFLDLKSQTEKICVNQFIMANIKYI